MAGFGSGWLSRTFSMSGVLRSATAPSASAMAARAGSRLGAPASINAAAADASPATASAARPDAEARSSS